ncbi:phosphoribosylanthranilate isomerase [uncultured Paludibaculum sp.]|uniref:phosphoribosylanthranilate isomerase n=1 Tax=uncultured Paludibaculum sp. TaxID=1765020 RepID=UPI002AABC92C|nr:phosphoribosylanthranilate isomerase [uncultured Paludibaculum sp.]
MSVLVKICGITRLEDAQQAVEAGADALGFNFWPRSPRYVEPAAARSMIDALGGTVLRVGVFVDETAEHVRTVMDAAGLDVAQIHGSPLELVNRRVWQAWSATSEGLRERIEASEAEAFLIDTPSGTLRGGTGKTFDWSLARNLPGRIILAGGLGPENVAEAVEQVRPWGVDACSRLETAPGRKDHEKVTAFLRAVRQTGL